MPRQLIATTSGGSIVELEGKYLRRTDAKGSDGRGSDGRDMRIFGRCQ